MRPVGAFKLLAKDNADAKPPVTGFGPAVLEYAAAHGLPTEHVTRLGLPDRLIAHATRKEQLAEVGLDPAGIARSVRDAIRAAESSEARVTTTL